MKKFIYCILVCCLMLSSTLITAYADSFSNNGHVISETTDILDDGTIITITVVEENDLLTRATTTKTGTKTYTAKKSNGDVLFTFSVKGTFSVNSGVSATCTSSQVSHSITDDSWSCKDSSSSKSGNTAKGTATFIKKILFVTTDTKDVSISLKCDKNGKLS